MAKTSDSIEVELPPEDAWAAASDLGRYEEWLVLHDGWRSELPGPDELGVGTKAVSVIKAKGTRVRFNWEVETYEPLRRVRLKGNGKGGVKVKLDLGIEPKGDGSVVTFAVDLGGLPLIGPAGKAAAMAVSGDIKKSLANFRALYC